MINSHHPLTIFKVSLRFFIEDISIPVISVNSLKNMPLFLVASGPKPNLKASVDETITIRGVSNRKSKKLFYSFDDFLKKYKYIIDNAMNIANH